MILAPYLYEFFIYIIINSWRTAIISESSQFPFFANITKYTFFVNENRWIAIKFMLSGIKETILEFDLHR